LIIYDTVSVNRNTEKVAKALAEALKAKGLEVDCSYVKNLDLAAVKGYDCVIAGSPTQMWKPTGTIMQFLGGFAPGAFSGKLAAAFDTQYEGRFMGNGAKGIEK